MLKEALEKIKGIIVVTINPSDVSTKDTREYFLSIAKIPSMTGKTLFHFPAADKVNLVFLANFVKTTLKYKSALVVIETTRKTSDFTKLKSYCTMVIMSKPHYATLKKVSQEHGFNIKAKNFHQAVTGSPSLVDDSDFDRIMRFFDGTSEVKVDDRFKFWIMDNSRTMLNIYEAMKLQITLSELSRYGRIDLISNLRLKGYGKPQFPYYLKKNKLKRRNNSS